MPVTGAAAAANSVCAACLLSRASGWMKRAPLELLLVLMCGLYLIVCLLPAAVLGVALPACTHVLNLPHSPVNSLLLLPAFALATRRLDVAAVAGGAHRPAAHLHERCARGVGGTVVPGQRDRVRGGDQRRPAGGGWRCVVCRMGVDASLPQPGLLLQHDGPGLPHTWQPFVLLQLSSEFWRW